MLTIKDEANFTWNYGNKFFLETSKGNYVWSDPDYLGGDNTITPFNGNYDTWIKSENIPMGRDKGNHIIEDYCGKDVKII
jgi:hypothetical protein